MLRPKVGPEQRMLLKWVEENSDVCLYLWEEQVKNMMLALLAGPGELPPSLWFGPEHPAVLPCLSGGVRRLGNCPVRHKGGCIGCISVAFKLRGRLAGAACITKATSG